MYRHFKKLDNQIKNSEILKPPNRTQFKRNRKLAFSTVGTPDYIAPEVFQ
jgi:hypothetical protein